MGLGPHLVKRLLVRWHIRGDVSRKEIFNIVIILTGGGLIPPLKQREDINKV